MLIKNALLADGTPADVWVYEGKIRAMGQNCPMLAIYAEIRLVSMIRGGTPHGAGE